MNKAGGFSMKVLYFDYAAIVLQLVLLASIVMRRMYLSKVNRVFLVMVSVALLTTSADIGAVALDNAGAGLITAKWIFHSLYLFLHVFTVFLYLYYVVILSDTWFKAERNIARKLVMFTPLLLVGTAMILNLFTHFIFTIDENGAYIRGPAFLFLYVITVFYAVYGTTKIIRYWKMLETMRAFSLCLAQVLMMAAAIAQYFRKDLLIDMFALATGLMFIFMMVQRPEEIIDPVTGLNKQSAYFSDLKRIFSNRKGEVIVMLHMTNYMVVREMLGNQHIMAFKSSLSGDLLAYLKKKRLRAECYYLGSGSIRIRMEEKYKEQAIDLAEHLNQYLKQSIIFNEMKMNMIVNVCVAMVPDDIDDLEMLTAFEEDFAGAKYTGNVYYASDIVHREQYIMKRQMDQIIENAFAENEFEVYYQPIYSNELKRFNSAEALLRLKSKKYGFVSPTLFISAAEKSGAIHRIGDFVMESVCSFIGSEEFKGLGLDYIEVNLSPAQCMENNLAEHMLEIIGRNHVQPEQVNLEITETAAGEIQNTIRDNISNLHDAGLSLSLDDFGTGYSNMQRIASLPFRIIKLDKTFTELDNNPNLVIVLENVVKMIKALNMKIVVEGIETQELVERFSEMECEYIQGYYYSKPLPKNELIAFLKSHNSTAA